MALAVSFQESQWLIRNPVLWVVFPVLAAAGYASWKDDAPWWVLGAMSAFIALLISLKLSVRVEEAALDLRFGILRHRRLSWDSIQHVRQEHYRPGRYGGWGLRFGRGAVAYTVWGRGAVRLELEGRDLVIGTKRPEELLAAIHAQGVPLSPDL